MQHEALAHLRRDRVFTLGRSKRTIRRWLADPDLKIRTRELDGERIINTQDLQRVEARKHAYTTAPTFGRKSVTRV